MPPSKTNSMVARIQNKIKLPNQSFNKDLEEIDEVISKLKKEYIRDIKTETQSIILKYDGLINEVVEMYNSFSNESNEELNLTNTSERDAKLKDLYTKRDIELIELKLKYIELSEKDKKSKKKNESKSNNEPETKLSEVSKEEEEYEPSLTSFNISPNNEKTMVQNPNIYVNSLIHKRVCVPFSKIGNNMNEYFKRYSENYIEGKCHKEGYIKPFSTSIVSYTTGLLKYDTVLYDVVYSMDICFPYENMEVVCKIKNITKIGIRGIISEDHNPIILFISREHNANKNFDDYEEGQVIKVKIIGHRFEINDENISVIGEII
jgi:DNA-directed RNA polymerase subunit E'/Rpb7